MTYNTRYMGKIYRKSSLFILAGIILASFLIMLSVSLQESPIMDELAHIPAGYSYLKFQDYRLNPEHPPLVKMLAAAPLMFMGLSFPTTDPLWVNGVNEQWGIGTEFMFQSGNNGNMIVDLARIAPILLTLLLIALIYFFSRELLGEWWALLPAFIFGLSPTVLSHGHYVTTDIGAALGILIGIYFYNKYVISPSRKHLIWAGLAFGVAQLFKFSAVLLVPFFLLLITVHLVTTMVRDWADTPKTGRWREFWKRALNYYGSTVVIFIIGMVLVVYPLYTFTTWNYPIQKQQTDTAHLLISCDSGSGSSGAVCNIKRHIADVDVWMAGNYITRPYAQFFRGVLMAAQRSVTDANIYFMGRVVQDGGPLYFPIVYSLKEPIPVLVMVVLAALLSVWSTLKTIKRRYPTFVEYLGTNFQEFSMFLFIVMYVTYSIFSPLNIGLRHLMPVIPLGYILVTIGLKNWVQEGHSKIKVGFIAALLAWFVLEVISGYPYYLSYFNEFVGTRNGYKYVTDSNYDWGQDLKRLATFTKENNIDQIAVDYFGGGNINYYLGNGAVAWQSNMGDPRESNIHWLAISINRLQMATEPLGPGVTRNAEDSYAWLTSVRPPEPGMGNVPKPDYIVGTSIFIYKLDGNPGT